MDRGKHKWEEGMSGGLEERMMEWQRCVKMKRREGQCGLMARGRMSVSPVNVTLTCLTAADKDTFLTKTLIEWLTWLVQTFLNCSTLSSSVVSYENILLPDFSALIRPVCVCIAFWRRIIPKNDSNFDITEFYLFSRKHFNNVLWLQESI